MRTSSAGRPLSRTKARNNALINQLATPGLGSLLAGRYLAGTAQLLLAVTGFGCVVAWFFALMLQLFQQTDSETPAKSVAWLGELGALLFVLSWVWALFTSLSLLREANENPGPTPPPIIQR